MSLNNGVSVINYNYDDLLSKQDLEDIIRKTSKQELINLRQVTVRPASDHILGFMCDHLRMTVEVKSTDGTKTYKYFLKCVPIANEKMKDLLLNMDAFSKEKKIYEIFDLLSTTLRKDPWYPLCYFSNDKVIVLEDLSQRGFVSLDPKADFTKEHCLTALAGLARLHASCFSFEEKKTKELGTNFRLEKEYENYMDNFIYDITPGSYYLICMDTMLAVVEKFSKYASNTSVISIIKSKWSSIWARNLELAKPSTNYRNVMAQRDLWGGNLMYKYENCIAKECIVIDYQTFGCQPPAADVMDILYMNTRRTDRDLWETECTEYYFKELQNNLVEEDVFIEDIVTKEDFVKSCQVYSFWALLHSCCENPMIHLNRENLDDILGNSELFGRVMNTLEGRIEIIFGALESDRSYREYILESVEQLIEMYILT